jgi:1-acyl-sn-glycerol-3-phosphate acyltransferase
MARERKVQDYDPIYSFLRHYVDLALKLSYRNIKYVGRERLPKDGAIIFAPNHTNALMDAMVILAMDHRPKVYVARADIFRNPRIAKILKFFKIMPIMRMRDGIDEVRKNNETIEKAVDVLRDKVPFCIFPEGTHQAKYSSLPLSKGIFRIAFQAQELMPDMPLYIVPVGLRYGNFFRFRSTARVQIGEPINVGEFVKEHATLTPAEQMNTLKELLDERMKKSIFYIPNDENYDAIYEICAAVVKQQTELHRQKGENRLDAHFRVNRITVAQVTEMMQNEPEKAAELLKLGNEAQQLRKSKRISLASVSVRFPILSRIIKTLFVLFSLPYSIPASLLTLPMTGVCAMIFKRIKDYSFCNSIRFVVNLVLWPLLMIIYSAITYAVLPWQWALPITLAMLPAPIVAQECWRLLRLFGSDVKLLANKNLRDKYRKIREILSK